MCLCVCVHAHACILYFGGSHIFIILSKSGEKTLSRLFQHSRYVSLGTSPNTNLILSVFIFPFPFHEPCINSAHFGIFYVWTAYFKKALSNYMVVLIT